MAVAGIEGWRSVPSAMHAFMMSETSEQPILSEGATGPVEKELTADCILELEKERENEKDNRSAGPEILSKRQ